MNINGTTISHGHPAYVIAEIGSNHNGSLTRALELINTAAQAGADCAKFQLFRADELYPGQHTDGAIPDEWLPELKDCCHDHDIDFICSVFSHETLNAYMQIEPAAIKIASPEATNTQLLDAAADTDVPVLVSTGAMTWEQTDHAHQHAFGPAGLALLHCVSAYPAPHNELNLNTIPEMRNRYGTVVGFSDHTLSAVTVPTAAVAAGASIIEKHFTYSRKAEGADHPFALEPDEFAQMVTAIRYTETLLGDGIKVPTASEDPTDRRQVAA